MARVYQQLGLVNDAVSQYQQAIRVLSQRAKVRQKLYVIRELLELDPDNVRARVRLAEDFATEGLKPGAVRELRLAAEMGCMLAPRDFAAPIDERRLFPWVETSYEPEDDNGFDVPDAIDAIRLNIQHLHALVLGEELSVGHPEIDRTYQVWLETWREGNGAMEADLMSHDLPWHCRYLRDFWTDAEVADEDRVVRDDRYTIRAWSAVITYLIADWRFLYE